MAAAVVAVVAAAALGIAFPAVGHARPAVDASTSTTVARSLGTARRLFGAQPIHCSQAPRVLFSYALAARFNGYASWTAGGRCTIRLSARRSFTRPQVCTLVLHEYGHLAGLTHSRSGLMRSDTLAGGYIFPACR